MLDTLTTELVEHIVGLLDDKSDLLSVRLVCQQLDWKAFRTFGMAWFSTLDSDLSMQSLRRLESIAHHKKLRLYVQKLRIGYSTHPPERPLGHGNHWMREASGCLDVSSPIASSFRDLLANNLIYCRSLEVSDPCDRYPELDGTATTLSRTDAVQLLFFAIAGISVRSFRIHIARTPATMNTNQLSTLVTDSGIFRDSWSSYLLDLELTWDLEYNDLLHRALDLIVRAPNLQGLSLNWHHSRATEHFFREMAEAETLPQITHLKLKALGKMTLRTLSDFLLRFQGSLAYPELSHIYLGSGSGSWGSVFGDLRHGGFSRLECITNWDSFEDSGWNPVFFCPLRKTPKVHDYSNFQFMERSFRGQRRVFGVRYKGKGKGMGLALKALEKSAYASVAGGLAPN